MPPFVSSRFTGWNPLLILRLEDHSNFCRYGKAWPEAEAIQRHREGGRPSRMTGHLCNTYHISHTQSTITCIPRAHSLLTDHTLLALSHTQVPRFSQLNPRHSACIFGETDDSPSCICQQSSMRTRTLPMPTLLAHTHRGSSVLTTQPQVFCLHFRRD